MRIAVIGTGYVGLVTGTCLADIGHNVICVDNNLEKIKQLNSGIIPIYEVDLEDLIKSNVIDKRLQFSSDLKIAVEQSEVCFIAVGTPQGEDGSADLQYVINVAEQIAKAMNGYKVIVNKSTVPVGTAEKVSEIIKLNTSYEFDVVSNPEFLKQGNAVKDFLAPDRIIIGSNSNKATRIMQDLYFPFLKTATKIILMDTRSAEMTKYTANSFLATKISFMNEIANLCEKVGADVEMVKIGISTDNRIGDKFLNAGIGYGGSCFPKDVKALIKIGLDNNCNMDIIKSVDNINKKQRQVFIDKIIKYFGNDLSNKTFAVWGLSFKPNTDDLREAPSITIINELIKYGAKIKAFDPKAMEVAKLYFKDSIIYSENMYDTLKDSDALLLLTEWNDFKRPNFELMKNYLKFPVIFDGRNQYNKIKLNEKGFTYFCIGS